MPWLAGGTAATLLFAAAPTAAQITLPPPSGEPQRLDFARDPLLAFVRVTAPPENFRGTVGKAIETHPAVTEAIAVQAEVAAVKTEVRAALFPRVDLQLLGARALDRDFGDRNAIVESLQPRSRADAAVVGDQLIYDFGATGNRIAAASARLRAAEAEVRRVAGDTALRAVGAWYDVLTYQTLVELSAATVARNGQILGDTRARVQQGIGASGDVARAEAYLADARGLGFRYERQLAVARGRYREIYGIDAPPRLVRPVAARSSATSFETAQALSRQAPGVAVAEARVEAAKRDARAAKADGRPRISAGLSGTRYDVFDGNDYEIRGTMVLRQSLTAGGAIRARAAQAGARQRQAEFVADRITAETERDAGIAWRDVELLDQGLGTLETAYIANRRSRDLYVEQFRVARGTLIDVLRAEQDYFAAATALLQGVLEADIARYQLLNRTGEILPSFGVTLTAREL